jgi:hypothetical protein
MPISFSLQSSTPYQHSNVMPKLRRSERGRQVPIIPFTLSEEVLHYYAYCSSSKLSIMRERDMNCFRVADRQWSIASEPHSVLSKESSEDFPFFWSGVNRRKSLFAKDRSCWLRVDRVSRGGPALASCRRIHWGIYHDSSSWHHGVVVRGR